MAMVGHEVGTALGEAGAESPVWVSAWRRACAAAARWSRCPWPGRKSLLISAGPCSPTECSAAGLVGSRR